MTPADAFAKLSLDIPERGASPLRVALVTNIPAPYRLPVYELLASVPGVALRVFFCSEREPDRAWNLDAFNFPSEVLRGRVWQRRGRYIHANPELWPALRRFSPSMVVTTGFNPTHLLAFAYARSHRLPHLAMTDGTLQSEAKLGAIHRLVRRLVYARTAAFIGASEGSFELYQSYGCKPQDVFKSHLCARNESFESALPNEREFDLIFCGRFVAGKLPSFALQVAVATAALMGRRVRMLFVGSGELDGQLRREAEQAEAAVSSSFAGFARQEELPALYSRARVLLFPTLGDTWGVVANEACAAGLPVIVSPEAGVAGELVRDQENGFVLPLDAAVWAKAAFQLLADSALCHRMSARSRDLVKPYTFRNAAAGLLAAIQHAGHVEHRLSTKPAAELLQDGCVVSPDAMSHRQPTRHRNVIGNTP